MVATPEELDLFGAWASKIGRTVYARMTAERSLQIQYAIRVSIYYVYTRVVRLCIYSIFTYFRPANIIFRSFRSPRLKNFDRAG
jgi:hypothetical protein